MSSVIFMMLPVNSHYVSCFPLALEYKKSGYEVFFFGPSRLKLLIEERGHNLVEFDYMPTYEARTFRGLVAQLIRSFLDPVDLRQRFKEFTAYRLAFQYVLRKMEPDKIFIDEHINHYSLFTGKFLDRTTIINTKLPSVKSINVPPLNSTYIPREPLRFVVCEWLWLRVVIKKWFRRTVDSIAFLGNTNAAFCRRHINSLSKSIGFTMKSAMPDYDAIVGVNTLSLISGRFDFPRRNQTVFGQSRHFWNISSEQLPASLLDIVQTIRQERKLIYCGIGTMSGHQQVYYEFITRVILAIGSLTDCILIVSTGDAGARDRVSARLPGNVYVYDFVPQIALLAHCDAMISHGGLNSIKECIYARVPILGVVNKVHKQTDTLGNIARVEFHKIGIKCNISDPVHRINERVRVLIGDPGFKQNITRMREEIEKEIAC